MDQGFLPSGLLLGAFGISQGHAAPVLMFLWTIPFPVEWQFSGTCGYPPGCRTVEGHVGACRAWAGLGLCAFLPAARLAAVHAAGMNLHGLGNGLFSGTRAPLVPRVWSHYVPSSWRSDPGGTPGAAWAVATGPPGGQGRMTGSEGPGFAAHAPRARCIFEQSSSHFSSWFLMETERK